MCWPTTPKHNICPSVCDILADAQLEKHDFLFFFGYLLQKVSEFGMCSWLHYMSVCLNVCIMCTTYMSVHTMDRASSSDLLELEFQNILRCYVGSHDQAYVLCKSAKCFLLQNHDSNSLSYFFLVSLWQSHQYLH